MRMTRLWLDAGYLLGDVECGRARYADDTDATLARRRGNSGDGVGVVTGHQHLWQVRKVKGQIAKRPDIGALA